MRLKNIPNTPLVGQREYSHDNGFLQFGHCAHFPHEKHKNYISLSISVVLVVVISLKRQNIEISDCLDIDC